MPGGRARGPGPRSEELLRWVARLDVAGLDATRHALRLSRPTIYSHAQRLQAAGLLTRIYDRDGSAVAITRTARQRLGAAGDVASGAQHGVGLRHSRAVSWVAALLELRGRAWVSEREARVLPDWQIPVMWPAGRGTHRPDLGAIIGDARVAIEVERTQKRARRLHAILAGYEDTIAAGKLTGGVLYICQFAPVRRVVEREAAAAGLSREWFRVRELQDVISEVRGGREFRASA